MRKQKSEEIFRRKTQKNGAAGKAVPFQAMIEIVLCRILSAYSSLAGSAEVSGSSVVSPASEESSPESLEAPSASEDSTS